MESYKIPWFQTTNQKVVQLFKKSKFGLQNKKSADENHYYHDVLVKICAPKKQKKWFTPRDKSIFGHPNGWISTKPWYFFALNPCSLLAGNGYKYTYIYI